jgi:predicted negative regulator of RcsB-dependent stress response
MPRKKYCLVILLGACLSGISAISADYADLRSDIELNTTVPEAITLSDTEQKKADALTAFALGIISVKPEKTIELLLEALRKDPSAELPLRLMLNQINSNAQIGKITNDLATIASANPDALRLSLAAVLLLKGQNNPRAEELANKTLECYRGKNNLSASDQKAIASLAGALASIYALNEKNFARGDRLLEKYLDDESYRGSYYLLESAVLFYHKAAKSADDSPFLWFWRSDKERYLQLKQACLDKIKANFANPAEHEIFASIAGMYEMLEMPDEVERLLLARIVSEPANPVIFTALAGYYQKNKQYAKAMLWWRAARNRFKLKDDSLMAYADAAFYARYFNEASSAYQRYLTANPKQNVARLMLGLVYIELGQYEWASRSLSPLPDSFMCLKLRGIAEDRQGNYKAALALLQQAEIAAEKTSEPTDAMFYLYIMMLTEKTKQKDLTLQYAELVIKKFSTKEPMVANAIGYTYADLNVKLEYAETLIRYAIDKEPDKGEYYDSLAWVLYRRGNYAEALRNIKIALEKQGKYPNAVIAEHAGDIQYAAGNIAEAVKYWRMSLLIYSHEVNHQNIEIKLNKALKEHQ